MIVKKYKTLKGYLKAVGGQVTVEFFFNSQIPLYRNGKNIRFEPCDELKREVADFFGKTLFKNKDRARNCADKLCNGWGDLSYFQCFYINIGKNGLYINNSLSGDAYNYCRREFMRSY